MAHHDVEFDSATLRAELDARWPDAAGTHRADVDETHRLVLLHPLYDGFISLEVTARTDLDGVFVVPDATLAPIITSHHRTGPLARGQVLPIDLELHPGKIQSPASSGLLELRDASNELVAPPVRITLATDFALDCVLAGAVDGPFAAPQLLDQAVEELQGGRNRVRRLAQRIEALESGRPDPGWRRRPWRRR